MPRAGWVKPTSDRRLSDLVSVGLLTRVFPPEVVDAAIAATERVEQRRRALPARVVAYFAIGLALYGDGSYEDVFAQLTDGLAWASEWREAFVPPSKSAIFQARQRLGADPLRELFRATATPLAADGTPGSFLAGRRLVALDGTCLDLADTEENAEHFSRPGVPKGEQSAFPQARLVGLVECGTHAIFSASIGGYRSSEPELGRELLADLGSGMLLLADRGLYGLSFFREAAETGADLLFRVSTRVAARRVEALSDGSFLAELNEPGTRGRKSAEEQVRVIDYRIEDGRDHLERYRLFTNVLDPDDLPATELAAAYAQRWEIESALDELKTHQRGPRTVLRSKSPDLVEQEIWGHLCCHFAIRALMWEAAAHAGHDPDRISFVAALRTARRSVAQRGAFPP